MTKAHGKAARGTFVERVLDGHARIDELDAEVEAWLAGPRNRALHDVLGLDADELELVASTPDALRYLLHARRFGRTLQLDEVRTQARVRTRALRLASEVVDPYDLADVETWIQHVDIDADAAVGRSEPEPSRA